MSKIFKISSQIVSSIIIFIFVIPMILSLLLQNSNIQTFIVRKATTYISNEIGSDISIRKIDISRYYNIEIYDLYVASPMGLDTLLHVKELSTRLNGLKYITHNLALDKVEIKGGEFNFFTADSTNTNIKEILSHFKSKNSKKKEPFKIYIGKVLIDDFTFRYKKENHEEVEDGINYQDMEMQDMSIHAKDLNIFGDSVFMSVKNISLTEKSGVAINKLKFSSLSISPSEILCLNGDVTLGDLSTFKTPKIKISYNNWNMQDYVNKIPMEVVIKDCKVDFATIAKFTKQHRKWRSIVEFSGTLNGTIANMSGVIDKIIVDETLLTNTKYSIKGIPDISKTIFDFKIENLSTDLYQVAKIVTDFSTSGGLTLPEILVQDTKFNINGEFVGKLTDFKTLVNISMPENENETANLDVHIKNGKETDINGKIATNEFNVGKFIRVKELGKISSKLKADGILSETQTSINLAGDVDSVQYKNYNYNSIKLDVEVKNDALVGYVGSTDKNLNFNFNGTVDMRNEIPQYSFNLDLKKVNLVAINLNKRDEISILSGRVLTDGSGTNIDNINGAIVIDKLEYINQRDSTIIEDKITITAKNDKTSKYLNVSSRYLDLTFNGVHSYNKLLDYIKRSAETYMPSLIRKNIRNIKEEDSSISNKKRVNTDDYYAITVEIKKPNNIANIFLPSLDLADDTKFAFIFNPSANSFSLSLSSKYIHFENNTVSNLSVDFKNNENAISLYARSDEMYVNNIYLPNFSIIGSLEDENIFLDFGFSNSSDNTYAVIKTKSNISYDRNRELQFKIEMLPSTLNFYKDVWKTSGGILDITKSEISIDNFNISAKNQNLKLDGVISNNLTDTLRLEMDNFSLIPTSVFTSKMGFALRGGITGSVVASALKDKIARRFAVDLHFKNNTVNDITIPDAWFFTKWSEDSQNMTVNFQTENQKFLQGTINMKSRKYFANVKIDDFNVKTISPFLATIGKDISGTADVDVTLSNDNGYFEINGNVEIPKISTTIIATNTKYNISASTKIENNQYKILKGYVTDGLGGSGIITGKMTNVKYKQVNYDIAIKADKMLCLNTTERDNAIYYGKAFASGDIIITGDRNKVTLEIEAEPSKPSTFFLPLGGKNLSEASFIKFASKTVVEDKKGLLIQKEIKKNTTAFEMKMRLTINPLLESEIVMDQSTGSSIKATGSGLLDIEIQPLDEIFTINGEYTLDKGTYRFILPIFKLFDKLFTIENGSWIRWSGDPLDAILNVNAIYELKASLAPLLGSSEDGSSNSNRVDVDCILNIRDKLTKPTITLGIEVPDADPEDQSVLRNALNTQEEISTQLFYLLISNSFYATGTSNTRIGISSTTTTGIEFLTNQIKNIISSDKFDFGINYHPSSKLSSDEFEIDFSAPILNNKLYVDVTGNYNFMNNSSIENQNQSNWSGDLYLTWLLNSSGNLSLKGFTKTIDTFDESQGLQETGVGIYYKASFDNLADLKARIKAYKKKRKEQKIKKKEKKDLKKKNQQLTK